MKIKPGPQPLAKAPSGSPSWCTTCGDDVTASKPHDLAKDCMARLDEQARRITARRDMAAAALIEQLHAEARNAAV